MRRSIVWFTLAAAIASRSSTTSASNEAAASVPAAGTSGFVLTKSEGERLTVRNGEVVIKVSPESGSPLLAMGTQTLRAGAGIGLHVHDHEDEVLFIHSGKGIGLLGDGRQPVESGSTVFIPHGVWHGVDNPDGELSLVWVVSPPGLEAFFRDTGSAPGAPVKAFTPAQLDDIRRKHGMRAKPR